MTESSEFGAKLQALREAFRAELPDRLAALERAWEPRSREAAAALQLLAHRLAGAGATFGYEAITTQARALEQGIMALAARETSSLLGAEIQAIEQWLAPLREAIRNGMRQPLPAGPAPMAPSAPPVQDIVLITGEDPAVCASLSGQLQNLGYGLRTLSPFSALEQGLDGLRPAALVVATEFPEGQPWTDGRLRRLLESTSQTPPILFVSSRGEFDCRLAAVQAGGAAYFLLPLDTAALVDRLDILCGKSLGEPFTVVLVEDDPMVLEEHALILEEAGMRVAKVQDPMAILHTLGAMRPDLILLDWYMPGCSGPELASVIRQMESLVGVPLVFLSAECNVEHQLEALDCGGDEFLTKPIEPRRLVAAVATRARRGRVLRSFMIRDSLTGLFNHSALKEQLDQALGMAQRRLAPLSFAILDLDHFKQVNDAHGHPMGDRVLMNLTRLMQLRLRRTDIIGRLGGEEFGVILPDTSAAQAKQVLDDLLEAFTQLRFPAGASEDFGCTFSAGLSAYPAEATGEALVSAADRALYEAKRAGRARVALPE
ncbi:MAG TPA: diguanylate cyclase [Holophagaceae bacterium]|nr:diguanylate cyclase [Holophagaceae bacterium]